jgi:hypothetical protein
MDIGYRFGEILLSGKHNNGLFINAFLSCVKIIAEILVNNSANALKYPGRKNTPPKRSASALRFGREENKN